MNERYGKLTAIAAQKINDRWYLECICDCGARKTIRRDHVLSGKVVSCGCYGRTLGATNTKTHGMSKTPLYRTWKNMRRRCDYMRGAEYYRYGGRGIRVCNEWANFTAFYEWAMQNGYQPGLSIDRIDNDGNYCPENCRWVTSKDQALNRSSNSYITFNGETKHVSEWDKAIGSAKSGRVRARLNAGWSIERAVTTPAQTKG